MSSFIPGITNNPLTNSPYVEDYEYYIAPPPPVGQILLDNDGQDLLDNDAQILTDNL